MPTYIRSQCDYCKKFFDRDIKVYNQNAKLYKNSFCCIECKNLYESNKYQSKKIRTNCGFCNKPIEVKQGDFKKSKSGRSFCNLSHAASYNIKLQRKSRRSKIEEKFYNLLVKEFPNLSILPNDKTMLNGLEVDIAIPSLKLAIEWNGVVHFKPIYGTKKLNNIQNKDSEKLKIASAKNINLIVIPDLVSNDKILNQAFNDTKNIINNLL